MFHRIRSTLKLPLAYFTINFISHLPMQKPLNRPPERRQLLWNVIEPGDPYDIRKSLIARLPGDKKPFMGDNLQIVCLFQAAEIERLIEYLDEYKLKYKEMERRELDRHYYEVQIKQLTEKCADSESLMAETSKLKQYIRRLKEQIYSNRETQEGENLKQKYESALQQLEMIHKENSELKSKAMSMSSSIQNWKTRCQALERSKARQIQEMRNSIQMQRRTQIDRQHREQELLRKFQIQRNQFQIQIRRLKEENNMKTRQLQESRVRLSEINKESHFGVAQLQAKCYDYQTRIKKYVEEIDRLNLNMRQIVIERNQLTVKYQSVENEIARRDNEIREYKRIISTHQNSISQLNRTVVELQTRTHDLMQVERIKEQYENRLVMMSQEVNRLNSLSQLKISESQEIMNRYSRLEYEVQTLRNENQNLTSRLTEKQSASRNVGELQHNLMRLTTENKRLSDQVSTVRQSMGGIERLKMENAQLRSKLQKLETQVLHGEQVRASSGLQIQRYAKRQEDHVRRINELEVAFKTLQAARADSRVNLELSDYKEKLLTITNENTQIKRNYEQQIIYLNQENSNMKKQLDNLRRRTANQNLGPSEDVIRLQEQVREWERKSKEWILEKEELLRITSDQQRRSRVPADWEVKSKEYEIKIRSLTEQLVGLRNDIPQDTEWYEATINQMKEEIERLQDKLKSKNQEIVNLQTRRAQTPQLERQLEEYISKYQKSQGQIILLNQQIERLSRNQQIIILRNQNNQLLAEKESLELKLYTLSQQFHQFRQSYERNTMLQELQVSLRNFEVQNEELKSKLRALQQQSNRATNDIRAYQNSIKQLKVENDNLKLRLLELENQISIDESNDRVAALEAERDHLNGLLQERARGANQGQNQLKQIIRNLEEHIHRLTLEKESLLTNNKEVFALNSEIQKLNARIRSKNQEVVNLDTKYKRLLMERTEIISMNDAYVQKIQEMNREIKNLENIGNQESSVFAEIDRLNAALRAQVDENTRLGQRIRELEQGGIVSGQLANEHQKLKLRYQEIVSKMTTYQQRLSVSSREAQTLMSENTNLSTTVQRLVNELNEYKKVQFAQASQSEKIVLIRQENQRLVGTINQLNGRIRMLMEENELLKRRINESTQRVQVELKNHVALYEQRIVNAEQRFVVEQQRFNAAVQQTNQLRRRIAELSATQRRIPEYEMKINNLTVENRRIHEYQQRVTTLTHQLQQVRRQDQTQKFIVQVNEQKQKYALLFNQSQLFQRQVQELSQKLQIQASNRINLQKQMRMLSDENQKLKVGGQQRLHQYESQITVLKQEITKFTADRGEIERLRRTEAQLANHLNESNRRVLELTQQIERLNVIIRQGKSAEAANMQNLIQEIQRLNNSLRIKVTESTEWQNKFMFLQKESIATRQEYQSLKLTFTQTGSQTDAYRKRIQEHQQKFVKLNSQFEKLSQIISELKRHNTILRQENNNLQVLKGADDKNRVLSVEIERLTSLVQSLEQQIAELRVRFVDQSALEKRIKEHLSLFVILFAEIESLRRRVKDKEKEVEQVRRSSLAPYMS